MENNKLKVLAGIDMWHLGDVQELNIKKIRVSDGPSGLRKIQNVHESMNTNETIRSTCFPSASAIACSFDHELVYKMGKAIGEECLKEYVDVLLGPGINIKRSPLGGRNFEYYSEDPLLSGIMGAAFVNGLQSTGVGACVKHFAANSQEFARMVNDSIVDQRALHEIYLSAFEYVVKNSSPFMLMAGYNKVNGDYAGESMELLTNILRNNWNYEGVVISDWGAVDNRVKALKAGLDVEMPNSNGFFDETLNMAFNNHVIDDELEKTIGRLQKLSSKIVVKNGQDYDQKAHNDLVKQIAAQSAVLLKNDENILPLNKSEKVLIIGELFEKPRIQGGGSSHIRPTNVATPLIAFKKYGIDFDYLKGYELDKPYVDKSLIRQAFKAAAKYSKILVFIGLPDAMESEGFDRENLKLPDSQVELIDALTLYYENVILIINDGSAIEMPFAKDVKAILQVHLYGQTGAYAIPELLYGSISPSGRLAESYPLLIRDTPCYYDFANNDMYSIYTESIFVGYRYYETFKKDVLFPFGFGLSYSEFKYNNLKIKNLKNFNYEISVDVQNIGKVDASDVVQVYVSKEDSNIYRPIKELKAFSKIFLKVGETKSVILNLNKRSFAHYDQEKKEFAVENGKFKVIIGKSSHETILEQELVIKEGKDFISRKEDLPSYFTPIGFTNWDFEKIYERKVPSYVQSKLKPKSYDYSSTFKALSKNYMASSIVEDLKRKLISNMKVEYHMFQSMSEGLEYMPLRNAIIMGNGAVDIDTADSLLQICNSDFIGGLSIYLKMLFKKPKKNSDKESSLPRKNE